jgi:hypothetical protein
MAAENTNVSNQVISLASRDFFPGTYDTIFSPGFQSGDIPSE